MLSLKNLLLLLTSLAVANLCFAQLSAGWIDANGTSLYYEHTGTGEPVIVIHGGPVLDHHYLQENLQALAVDHKMIYYDQRACGKSEVRGVTPVNSLTMLVDDLEELRKKLAGEKVHLLGHSWGAMLAALYATKYPQQVKSLILCSPMPPSYQLLLVEEATEKKRKPDAEKQEEEKIKASEAFRKGEIAAVEAWMNLSFRSQIQDSTARNKLVIVLPPDYNDRVKVYTPFFQNLPTFDIVKSLTSITAPTLIVYGDHDSGMKAGEATYHTIPQSSTVILKNCGHFPFIEQSTIFSEKLRSFWKTAK